MLHKKKKDKKSEQKVYKYEVVVKEEEEENEGSLVSFVGVSVSSDNDDVMKKNGSHKSETSAWPWIVLQ